MNKPFFTIGITTYNRIDLLKQLLDSILNQNFTDFEIIIGNDFQEKKLSQSDLEISDKRVRIINHKKNKGELDNMNSLLEIANGRYFTWQFDDDLCHASYMLESFNALEKHKYPKCVYFPYSHIYGTSKISDKSFFSKTKSKVFKGNELLRNFISGKTKISILAGFYETNFLKKNRGATRLSGGHIALFSEFLLVVQAGLLDKIAYINNPLVYIRIHDGSFSSSARELSLHKEAGINLINKSIKYFSSKKLIKDFEMNLEAYLKSVICVVIVKSSKKNSRMSKQEILDYCNSLKKEFKIIKDPIIHEKAKKALRNTIKWIPLYIFKSKIKSLIPDNKLKLAREVSLFLLRFSNKSFIYFL